jgi:DeoR/GlpR family transcriptional regulator of sugar metabolism
MLKSERLKIIEDTIARSGRVEVAQLSRLLSVSEMTIRRDLSELARQKRVIRSHGGALLFPDTGLTESPYELRLSTNIAKKQLIAHAALSLIEQGSRVFFDCSTTTYCLSKIITNEHNILAVTDTLFTAMELNAKPNVRVIALGGEVSKTTNSCVGGIAESLLDTMYFNTAFIGVPSISEDGILSVSSVKDMEIKKSVIQRSERCVVLIDGSKIRRPEFLRLGHISDISTIITDESIPASFVDYCRTQHCELIIAKDEHT